MTEGNQIFDKYYEEYRTRLTEIDFEAISATLGLRRDNQQLLLPFFNEKYVISPGSITNSVGESPSYIPFVIVARYLMLCPDEIHENSEWVSFKDFKKVSHFTNVNYFASDTEGVIAKHFSGKLDQLAQAGRDLGGVPCQTVLPYDLSMQFMALPRISLLLLFNDSDEDFPAQCTVLFSKHAEWYLDPESLAITSAHLARSLQYTAGKT